MVECFPEMQKALGSSPSMAYKGEVFKMNVQMDLKWMILSSAASDSSPSTCTENVHHLQRDPCSSL